MTASARIRQWLARAGLLAALLAPAAECGAVVISFASPITTVPAEVPATLTAHQFLLPIVATGAAGLQDWRFDLGFDPLVVQPIDLGGLYGGVFAAPFNAAQPALSSITASGFLLGDLLEGIAGFSGGVNGDGLLLWIGFEYLPLQNGEDPGFEVGGVTVTQPVPEPGSLALLSVGLLVLLQRQRSARKTPPSDRKDPL